MIGTMKGCGQRRSLIITRSFYGNHMLIQFKKMKVFHFLVLAVHFNLGDLIYFIEFERFSNIMKIQIGTSKPMA